VYLVQIIVYTCASIELFVLELSLQLYQVLLAHGADAYAKNQYGNVNMERKKKMRKMIRWDFFFSLSK
jgi:hypothetical protein